MLPPLAARAERVILARPTSPRAREPETLRPFVPWGRPTLVEPDAERALAAAAAGAPAASWSSPAARSSSSAPSAAPRASAGAPRSDAGCQESAAVAAGDAHGELEGLLVVQAGVEEVR